VLNIKNLQKKVPIPRAKVLKAAKAALRKLVVICHPEPFASLEGRLREGSLSIVFVGTKRMRAINKKYLGHDYVTDVLTFDLGENTGEIIICPRIACANAKARQTSMENEIILYVVHGILHLAGFDDHKPKDIIQMRRMENELLKL